MYRVATPLPVYQTSQVLAPFAWRLATTLPQAPALLTNLYVNPGLVSREEAEAEIGTLISSFPYPLKPHPVLQTIHQHVLEDVLDSTFQPHEAAIVYYLAYLGQESLYSKWTEEKHPRLTLSFYHQLRTNIDSETAQRTMREIVILCASYDLQDRFDICRDHVLSTPSHVPGVMRDWILVFLAHYHRGWVRVLMEHLRIRRVARIQALVRADISLYCFALTRLKPMPGWSYVQRFRKRVYEEEEVDIDERLVTQQALAFCSKYPIQVWQVMGWTCTRKQQRRVTKMTEEGFTPRIDEVLDMLSSILL